MQTKSYNKIFSGKLPSLVELRSLYLKKNGNVNGFFPGSLQRTPQRQASWEMFVYFTESILQITSGRILLQDFKITYIEYKK